MARRYPRSRWRAARLRRRGLAAGLVLLAGIGVVRDLRPSAELSVTVLVAARPVAAGQVVGESDLTTAQLPAGSPVAAGALSAPEAIGRMALGGLGAGEVVRSGDLVAGQERRAGSGRVAMPLALASPAALPFLTPGMLVDVVWSPVGAGSAEASVLARGVRVLVVEQPQSADGILDTSGSGATLLVEARAEDAVGLAEAQHSGALSLILP